MFTETVKFTHIVCGFLAETLTAYLPNINAVTLWDNLICKTYVGNGCKYITDGLRKPRCSGWSVRWLRFSNRIYTRNLFPCVSDSFGTRSLSNSALQGLTMVCKALSLVRLTWRRNRNRIPKRLDFKNLNNFSTTDKVQIKRRDSRYLSKVALCFCVGFLEPVPVL